MYVVILIMLLWHLMYLSNTSIIVMYSLISMYVRYFVLFIYINERSLLCLRGLPLHFKQELWAQKIEWWDPSRALDA